MPIRGAGKGPSGAGAVGKVPKWKMQSEQFRNAMRAANGGGGGGGKSSGGYGGGAAAQEYDDRI